MNVMKEKPEVMVVEKVIASNFDAIKETISKEVKALKYSGYEAVYLPL